MDTGVCTPHTGLSAYLCDDESVGDAHDEAVLGGVVLVLILHNQALARAVVRLALCQALKRSKRM
eukprot:18088-Eustigmatos_ZCMA.PRE.1